MLSRLWSSLLVACCTGLVEEEGLALRVDVVVYLGRFDWTVANGTRHHGDRISNNVVLDAFKQVAYGEVPRRKLEGSKMPVVANMRLNNSGWTFWTRRAPLTRLPNLELPGRPMRPGSGKQKWSRLA